MIELNRISEVRKHARRVIQKYGITTPGTPLEKIMSGEKLELVRRPWGRNNQTGGLLYRPERVIAINEDHPEVRRRFSTAHELGHYFLGHNYLKDRVIDIDHPPDENPHLPDDADIEQEAHHFANELLVPLPILVGLQPRPSKAKDDGDDPPFNNPFAALKQSRPAALTPQQLARRFLVSDDVMYRALKYHALL